MNGNESLTTTEIKKQNCKKGFDYLYQNQRTSKQTIAQALGLSMPTVSQNLKLLEGAGVVRRDGFYESTGGRKAHVLRFVQDARVAVGVAILEGSVQLCAVDLLGEVLREETHPCLLYTSGADPAELLRTLGGGRVKAVHIHDNGHRRCV